jgi:hypothetical protein
MPSCWNDAPFRLYSEEAEGARWWVARTRAFLTEVPGMTSSGYVDFDQNRGSEIDQWLAHQTAKTKQRIYKVVAVFEGQ